MLNSRPLPALDPWIIFANYVRKLPFQIALVLIPFFVVFLVALRSIRYR
ncbi:hypothetical protein MACJ_003331 [Theileria orientalis]|uniref:Uncharacterized protein n=1 Tax=Theileria orientalis TaxID=68886 RepID=A0A976XJN9_THEOR|nr:hypothetical protein MACJ_003331 [Theileria orientalis]